MDLPTECPLCGAWSMTQDREASALLAVCDVLVLKALEAVGKRVVRVERSRAGIFGNRPYYLAHTIWQPDDATVSKALRGAWDVVPALLDEYGAQEVTVQGVMGMLDSYVHDLAITGTRHHRDELRYRFATRLGLPVYLKEHSRDDA